MRLQGDLNPCYRCERATVNLNEPQFHRVFSSFAELSGVNRFLQASLHAKILNSAMITVLARRSKRGKGSDRPWPSGRAASTLPRRRCRSPRRHMRTKEFRHRHACGTTAVRGDSLTAALHSARTRAWATAQRRKPKTRPPAMFPGFGVERLPAGRFASVPAQIRKQICAAK